MNRVLLLLLLLCNNVSAQPNSVLNSVLENLPKSPEAYNIAKFTSMPEGNFTGNTSFNIPIYTITVDEIDIPISIKNSTTGIRINELSTNIGLGWFLDVGAISIDLQTVGKHDTQENSLVNISYQDYLNHETNEGIDYQIFKIANKQVYVDDNEPDVYTYNLMSNSGKFIIVNKKEIFFPSSDIKIGNDFLESKNKRLGQPLLTDNKGNRFKFISDGFTKTSTVGNLNISNLEKISNVTYKPIEILSNKGNRVNFVYGIKVKTDEIEQIVNSKNFSRELLDLSLNTEGLRNNENLMCNSNESPTSTTIIATTEKNYITEIIFPNGRINFEYSMREDILTDKKLSRIIVHSDNKIIKEITLNHSYFIDELGGKRLKIDSVDDSSIGGYQIKYYEDYQTYPSRFSNSRDFWGLYNGKKNTDFIPKVFYSGIKLGEADFSPNLDYAKQLSIHSLKFPTGATHYVDYELNDFSKLDFSNFSQYIPKVYEVNCHGKTCDKYLNRDLGFYVPYGDLSYEISTTNHKPLNDYEIIQGKDYNDFDVRLSGTNGNVFYNSFSDDSSGNIKSLGLGNLSIKILDNAKFKQDKNLNIKLFWYESIEQDSIISYSGGLRISKYQIFDSNDLLELEKRYSYKIPNTEYSSGVNKAPFITSLIKSEEPNYGGIKTYNESFFIFDQNQPKSCITYTISNVINFADYISSGVSTIGYSHVEESIYDSKDRNNIINYKILYNFWTQREETLTIDDSIVDDNSVIVESPIVPIYPSYKYGTLLRKTFQNQGNDIIRKYLYYYNFDAPSNSNNSNCIYETFAIERKAISLYNPIFISRLTFNTDSNLFIQYPSSSIFSYKAHTYCYPFYFKKSIKELLIEYFDNNKEVVTEIENIYSPNYAHLQPIATKTTNSKGETTTTEYQYPLID